jgi:hypothetical protein
VVLVSARVLRHTAGRSRPGSATRANRKRAPSQAIRHPPHLRARPSPDADLMGRAGPPDTTRSRPGDAGATEERAIRGHRASATLANGQPSRNHVPPYRRLLQGGCSAAEISGYWACGSLRFEHRLGQRLARRVLRQLENHRSDLQLRYELDRNAAFVVRDVDLSLAAL